MFDVNCCWVFNIYHWVASDSNLSIFQCITLFFYRHNFSYAQLSLSLYCFLLHLAFVTLHLSILHSVGILLTRLAVARMLQQSINFQRANLIFPFFKRIQTLAISYSRWVLLASAQQRWKRRTENEKTNGRMKNGAS